MLGEPVTTTSGRTAVALRDVDVRYGAHTVVSGVSIRVARGEKTALVGENGAGKSSLAKVLTGVISPARGTVELAGVPVRFDSPRAARDAGIALLPQELTYAPQLTAAENICLPQMPMRYGFSSQRQIVKQAAEIASRLGYDIPLRSPMNELTLMQRQIVEILKAFGARPHVLVLDEPTAALDGADSKRLLDLVDRVADSGVCVIYISHRLDEVFEHCDSVHVLRSGDLVLSEQVPDTSPAAVVHAMLDRSLDDVLVPKRTVGGATPSATVSLRDWRLAGALPGNEPFTLTARRGEIVALYGIRGSGAEEIARALVGLSAPVEGSLSLNGAEVPLARHPHQARSHGIAYIPPDRKTQGLFLTREIPFSTSVPALPKLSTSGIRSAGREQRRAKDVLRSFQVVYQRINQQIAELSGGNQQKVLVGSRTYDSDITLLVAQEPTRGVDVGARHEIHKRLRELAEGGLTIILVTSDLEEAIILADKLAVIRDNSLVEVLNEPMPDDQQSIYNIAGGLAGE